jgi:hypothetical protein
VTANSQPGHTIAYDGIPINSPLQFFVPHGMGGPTYCTSLSELTPWYVIFGFKSISKEHSYRDRGRFSQMHVHHVRDKIEELDR